MNDLINRMEKLEKQMKVLEGRMLALKESVDKQSEWHREDLNKIFYGNDAEHKLSDTEPGVLGKLDEIIELLKQKL